MENNPPFYIGQKVVCVSSVWKYVKGKEYVVGQVDQCPNCKVWKVGCIPRPEATKRSCSDCGITLPYGKGLAMAYAYRFAPIQPAYSNISKEIAESVKEVSECPDKIIVPEPVNN